MIINKKFNYKGYYDAIHRGTYDDEMKPDDVINKLVDLMLGDDWYIIDPVRGWQGNKIIYESLVYEWNKTIKHKKYYKFLFYGMIVVSFIEFICLIL